MNHHFVKQHEHNGTMVLTKKHDFSATSFGTCGKIREPNNQIANDMERNNEGTTVGF